ncbi:hypothetical protein MMC26_000494, partial [Xylographa opegraphella]|nr:hypothetical protein [Xylographa opegraphella]
MPAKPEVKYPAMTSKQAKAAYKKSGPAGPSEWEVKALARQHLLLKRAQNIRDNEKRAKIHKEKREKKKTKEMEERLKRGLPVVEEGYISPRQTRMHTFFPIGASSDDDNVNDIADEFDDENDSSDPSMEDAWVFDSQDSQGRQDLAVDSVPMFLDVSKARSSRLSARVTPYSASQVPYRPSQKHVRSSSPAFQDDCRPAKRKILAIEESSPEVFFDESEWPPTKPNADLHSVAEKAKVPSSAVIIDHKAKTISGSLAKKSECQQGHGELELSLFATPKQCQHNAEPLKLPSKVNQALIHEESIRILQEHLSAQPQSPRSLKSVTEALLGELCAEDIDFSDVLDDSSFGSRSGEAEVAEIGRHLQKSNSSREACLSENVIRTRSFGKENTAKLTEISHESKECVTIEGVIEPGKAIVNAGRGSGPRLQGEGLDIGASKNTQVVGRIDPPSETDTKVAIAKIQINATAAKKQESRLLKETAIMNGVLSAQLESNGLRKPPVQAKVVEQIQADNLAGKPALVNCHTECSLAAEFPYTKREKRTNAFEQSLANKLEVVLKETNRSEPIDDDDFGISKEDEALMAQILSSDLKPDTEEPIKDVYIPAGVSQ